MSISENIHRELGGYKEEGKCIFENAFGVPCSDGHRCVSAPYFIVDDSFMLPPFDLRDSPIGGFKDIPDFLTVDNRKLEQNIY